MKKLAIIGCGGIGRYHLDHFLQFRDIELAGFCDIILERAEAFAKAAGSGLGFTDYKEMYDAVQPDMVFICIPPYAHGDIEFETIRRRIPFFVEKPVALSLDLAHEIRQRIQEAGLITASGFQCRYSNLVESTVEFIQDHEIVFIDCVRVGGIPGTEWWKSGLCPAVRSLNRPSTNLTSSAMSLGNRTPSLPWARRAISPMWTDTTRRI